MHQPVCRLTIFSHIGGYGRGMARMRARSIRRGISCAALLALAGCGESDPPVAERAVDPAVLAAINDPILVDPDLSRQNEGNAALTVNVDMVNSFGWPSPDGETTLHADGAKPVQALALGLMMSELTFHFGDSGGPAVDRLGRLFGIISKSFTPTMPLAKMYKSYVRPVSELRPEHGLVLAP